MYLHNDFLVQRLLVQRDPEAQAPLLDVSATLLSTVLVFGTHHQHMIDIQRDFTWVVSTLIAESLPCRRLTDADPSIWIP